MLIMIDRNENKNNENNEQEIVVEEENVNHQKEFDEENELEESEVDEDAKDTVENNRRVFTFLLLNLILKVIKYFSFFISKFSIVL